MNWEKVNIHCSSIYNIMARVKTNMDLWRDACEELIRKEQQWDALKKKDGVRGVQIEEAIEKLKVYIPILEAGKDLEEPLSTGCKTHLSGVYATEKYHKWNPSKDIGSIVTEKGKECEPLGLELANKIYGLSLVRNKDRIDNEWFSGHMDAFEVGEINVVHDIKCPGNIESFFSYINKDLSPVYYWQMQGYMDLTGANVAKVHFCLVNSPEHQIKSASEALLRRMDVVSEYSPEFVQAQAQLVANLTYDDIPEPERIFTFTVERNEEDIQKARRKVEKCREYLKEFEMLHLGTKNTM